MCFAEIPAITSVPYVPWKGRSFYLPFPHCSTQWFWPLLWLQLCGCTWWKSVPRSVQNPRWVTGHRTGLKPESPNCGQVELQSELGSTYTFLAYFFFSLSKNWETFVFRLWERNQGNILSKDQFTYSHNSRPHHTP